MDEDKLKKSRLSSIYGQLRSKMATISLDRWRNQLPAILFFALLLLSALYQRVLSSLLIVWLCVYVTQRTVRSSGENRRQSKLYSILLYAYTVVPSFSMLHLVNLRSPADLVLWLFLLFLTIRIASQVFEGIFEGRILARNLHPTRTLMGFLGSLLVSIPVGLVSSLFLRQRLVRFTFLNLLMAALVYGGDILDHRLGKRLDPTQEDLFLRGYNNMALLASFLTFLTLFKLIEA
ncbi:MAG: phosphatidate cytidylyltransferase [Rickettsiales bacterium]|jgi:predicted CDP-diglyceride synthetase/phosphatidate cytidylyltransferase|nr:phosphatidate cytidylyltransferase [Rickettsiales bacterium]